jgi:hypothetical protein
VSPLSFRDIGLPAAQLRAVEKKAKHAGQTASQYVQSLVKRDLLSDKTFAEILRPIRDDVRKSGLTERELDGIVDRARRATRPALPKKRKAGR